MKRFLYIFVFLFFFLIVPHKVFANSEYVLPYPSFMPGNKIYLISKLLEKVEKYWYFGNFGQFSYNLKFSDKYLVEAKTLFEYKQYLLGVEALKRSDYYFQNISPFLVMAKKSKVDTTEKKKILKNAAVKHIETLNFIKQQVPKKFDWQPEKSASANLSIHTAIDNAIIIRMRL